MMEKDTSGFENLKIILKNFRYPELLDEHPWTQSLVVQETLISSPQLAKASPGQQLVSAIALLFSNMQPTAPPRRGKRLDPRWGEFGLLAALYFTPFNHGTPFPTSLLEAWERIDPAILYHVYGKPLQLLTVDQVKRYQLVGGDVEYGSASTLSDWHRKGLQRLAEILLDRERFLSNSSSEPSIILGVKESRAAPPMTAPHRSPTIVRRTLWLSAILVLVAALIFGGLNASQIYRRGGMIYQDVTRLQARVGAPLEMQDLEAAGPELTLLRRDLSAFKQEARLLLWLSPGLGWVPKYGGDLASAPHLLDLAEHLVNASDISLQAGQPLLHEFASKNSALDPAGLTALLVQVQPQLEQAHLELEQALSARRNIQAQRLSPRLHDLLVGKVDPVLKLADEGLSLATALPGLLGAAAGGPKTYLLLVQNEDELRPTGGFITSVGNLVLHDGQVISLEFEEAGELEDWSKPYPAAPWQLQEYMNSPVLVLRDSNWFTDFPTAAEWAEYLYAYTHAHSVDGVIAFNQQFLVMLLGQIGPLEVEGAPYPITDGNVIAYMREAKTPPSGEAVPAGWYRKEFIRKIADAILKDFTGGGDHDWPAVAKVLTRALEERHLLLQFDDPVVAGLLAGQGWDNAVRPAAGDYLMVTDTNIGFNKTNAVVEVSLTYDVDLTELAAPVGALVVTHKNNASKNVPCIQWNTGEISGEEAYPINRCYWSYVRVYKQAGVELLDASPHAIPGDWMMMGEGVPARVDELKEGIVGLQGFGTLLVVPGGQTLHTGFSFTLPPGVLIHEQGSGQYSYRLKIQKQPGTLTNPVTIRIHLPNRSNLESITLDAVIQDENILINTELRTDVELALVFSLPYNVPHN